MLDKIRKASDNFAFRTILLFIVIAFGVWGVKDMLGAGNNFSVVTFKNASPIKYDEFHKARMIAIRQLQTMSNIVLSEEDIKQYGIDDNVMTSLISKRLAEQLVQDYDIDFSDSLLASMIKQSPSFQGKDGKFDRALFKATAGHLGLTEDQYITEIKKDQAQRMLLNILVSTYYIPKAIESNIVDFLAEERIIDVVSIDLNSTKYVVLENPTKNQLEKFYKSNPELFTLPEKRDVDYIIINEHNVKKLVSITQEDIKQFFEENKEELGANNLNAVKDKIVKTLQERRISELVSELVQNIQDEISAGNSIHEIANKFEFKVNSLKNVTASQLVERPEIGSLVDTIFRADEDDVSYPVELSDPQNVAIFCVQKIFPSRVQDLSEVNGGLLRQWQVSEYNLRNLRVMEDFVTKASAEDFINKATEMKLALRHNIRIRRADIEQSVQFSPDMLADVFVSPIGKVSGIYNDGDKVLAMVVRKISHSEATKKHIVKNDSKKIVADLKRAVIDELLFYLNKKENTKRNAKFLPAQESSE